MSESPAGLASGLGDSAGQAAANATALANERPEVSVGAAFAGGLVLALVLKRLVS